MSTRRRSESDFSEEIRAHLALETDRLIAEGMDPDEARRAALRRFGNVTAAEERYYESRRFMPLDRARQDLRDAARSLGRFKVATLVGVLSIAAGIGATATTLTVRDVVFRNAPPEYRDPERLSAVRVARAPQPIRPIGSNPPGELVAAWREALGPTALAAARPPQGVRDVRTEERVETVPVRAATAEFFAVLGVAPVIGRSFDAATSEAPALLSYRLWQQWFDGRSDAIGRVLWIDGAAHTIVGVLPRRFWFSEMSAPVWTLLEADAIARQEALEVVVRRPSGQTPEALADQLRPLLGRYAAGQPADRRQWRLQAARVQGTPLGAQVTPVLPWLLGTAALLTLLIACANVAILMIAQWTAREHEFSIRASLGASRGRLVRALLTESLLIACCGGALGVLTTYALRGLLLRSGGSDAGFFELTIQPAVLAQVALATLCAGILAGLAPALIETRRLQGNPLLSSACAEPLRQRWRHSLVVLEISVTVALLVAASAFINGYRRSLEANLGFATRPMLSVRVENQRGLSIAAALEAASAVPGVAAVASSTSMPFAGSGPRRRVATDASGSLADSAELGAVTPAFFETLGVPLRAGRRFSEHDSAATRTVVLGETLAKRLFGERDAVGNRIFFDDSAYDVVGVAADFASQPFFREYPPRVFVPLAGTPAATRATLLIRAAEDPAPLVQALRRAIRDAAPGNIVTSAFTFDQVRLAGGQEVLLGTAPLLPLVLIGLLLTSAGIYGVLAFAVARRSRELAVRVAIGATGRDLVRLVAAHSLRLVTLGVAIGAGFTFALTRAVRASGGAGTPFDADATAFVPPILLIAAVAALATWLPSRRARRIDPAVLLRTL